MSRGRMSFVTVVCLAVLTLAAASPERAPEAPPPARPSPVPVHLSGIKVIGPEQILLLLANESEDRAVPISIGRDQGVAIYLGKTKTATPRPMTHDLIANMLQALGAVIERVTVTNLKDNVYFAEIGLRASGKVHPIDARPSDAIALAVRTGAPLYASPALLQRLDALSDPDSAIQADSALGVTVQELETDLAESLGAAGITGVLVASVRHGGVAEKIGVLRGDIVRSIDGRPVPNLAAWREAASAAVKTLTVWREGRETTLRAS